jgi:putative transposase
LDRFEFDFSTLIFLAGKGVEAMKASKFTGAQVAFILKRGEEGLTAAEICRKARISQANYSNWKGGGCYPHARKNY